MRRSYFNVAAVLVLSSFLNAKANAITFNDIDFWVGSGVNEAALIFDWNDGKSPGAIAWGFRWDGTKSVGDMMQAIAGTTQIRTDTSGAFVADISGADPRLFIRLSQHSFGNALFGVGYDLDGDGGAFLPGVEGNETGSASDPDDHYIEGWFNKGYFFGIGGTDAGGFDFNEFAYDSLNLTDGNLYGFAFDDDFSTFNGGTPGDEPQNVVAAPAPGAAQASIPEPGTIIMLGSGVMGLMLRRRSHVA